MSSSPAHLARAASTYFEREAENYTSRSDSGFWDWWRRRERRAVLSVLRPRAGERILDAGCGAGYYARVLKRRGALVIACDYLLPMAMQASRHLRVPAFVSDLHDPAIAPVFDAVLCAGALEFCGDPERAIVEMSRGLRSNPRSRLVVMLPSDRVFGRLYRTFHRTHGMQINLFSRGRLRRIAREAGLRIDRVAAIGFNDVVEFRRERKS